KEISCREYFIYTIAIKVLKKKTIDRRKLGQLWQCMQFKISSVNIFKPGRFKGESVEQVSLVELLRGGDVRDSRIGIVCVFDKLLSQRCHLIQQFIPAGHRITLPLNIITEHRVQRTVLVEVARVQLHRLFRR